MYYGNLNENKLKRVVILARKSTAKQMRNDAEVPIPVQKDECLKYINQHPDWVFLDEIYEQESAYNNRASEREPLIDLLRMAKNNEFEVLLVYYSDRLSRLSDDGMNYIKELFLCGIEVWSTKEGQLKIDTLNDKLNLFLKLYGAEMESEKTSERVKDAQKRMIREGRRIGGVVPYGYKLINSNRIGLHNRILKDTIIIPEQAEIVREIFRLYIEEGYGGLKIANYLNDKKIPNKNGKEWQACTVYDMLKNPFYKGTLCYKRRPKKSKHGQTNDTEIIAYDKPIEELRIIDDVTWEKAQMIRKKRADIFYNPDSVSCNSYNGNLILQNKAYCGYCGGKFSNGSKYIWKDKGYQRIRARVGIYKCIRKSNGITIEHKQSCYYSEPLEAKVFKSISGYMNLLKDSDVNKKVADIKTKTTYDLNSQLNILESEIKKIQDDILILQSYLPDILMGKSDFDSKTIADAITNNEKKKASLDVQISDIKNKLDSVLLFDELDTFVKLIPVWDDEFNNADIQRKKVLIDNVVNKIIVTADNIDIEYKFNNLLTENPYENLNQIERKEDK